MWTSWPGAESRSPTGAPDRRRPDPCDQHGSGWGSERPAASDVHPHAVRPERHVEDEIGGPENLQRHAHAAAHPDVFRGQADFLSMEHAAGIEVAQHRYRGGVLGGEELAAQLDVAEDHAGAEVAAAAEPAVGAATPAHAQHI